MTDGPAAGNPAPKASAGATSGALPPPAPSSPPQSLAHPEANPQGKRLLILALSAVGVVYGDIGTSVLYALKECFGPMYGVAPTRDNVDGVLSLIFWSLTLVVSVKYIFFIMRADNRGEGGVLALLALVQQQRQGRLSSRGMKLLIGAGLFGSALLYGDGVITPAVSVLGAMEGIAVRQPRLAIYVPYISCVIIVVLFLFQKYGTAKVGRVFGPITLLWFFSIGILGLIEIAHAPEILLAINPWYAVKFFFQNGSAGFIILGAVVLAITGAEALYADMGHFGRRPIRVAWYAVVFPALLLNYFGQGALLLRDPIAADNPFYHLVPEPLLYPMVVLATLAAVIASQALISGAFSLTRQAMQLGYTPRVSIQHTSAREAGQIYIREVNIALAVLCIVLVLWARDTSKLAGMYGVAVTGTMTITTILFYVLARWRWNWPTWASTLFLVGFLMIDLGFLAANLIKVEHGGWFPLALAAGIYLMMSTWKRGREMLRYILKRSSLPLELFLQDIAHAKPVRVPGTAVFMTSEAEGAPVVLLHHLKHNKVLHERVLLLSIVTGEVPEIPALERAKVEDLSHGFYRVTARYGFMQSPDVPEIMQVCQLAGITIKPVETSYYLGRERLIVRRDRQPPLEIVPGEPKPPKPLNRWRKKLFVLMSRNARSATEFFNIPPNRVVELGAQIEF
ncbi:MAG TPA: potassium transporter Kup [Gemmatimonadaceae bacterium]|nr:potassium transporter Kup [Gemmatimonadaceae bacterium]